MINPESIKEEINQLDDLRRLMAAFESIAVIQAQKIRKSVLEDRIFYEGINRVFQEVVQAYGQEMLELSRKRRSEANNMRRMSLLKRNGKTIAVLLSANAGLYGDIIQKTFSLFIEHIRRTETDILIVGAVGKNLFDQIMPEKKYMYVPFPDDKMNVEEINFMIQYLEQFDGVTIFFGQFKSFLSLEPSSKNISGDMSGHNPSAAPVSYVFEPSLEKVVVFFETEIFASIFWQLLYESRLAKLASRMALLNNASINIDAAIKQSTLVEQKIRHRVMNKKQLEVTSGILAHNLGI